ncbi:hypothetical protein EMIT0215P_310010 [Pseudomonas serboccidentalis]
MRARERAVRGRLKDVRSYCHPKRRDRRAASL